MNNQIKRDSETRMMRGHELIEKGIKIQEQEDGSFAVPSLTRNIVYEVKILETIWVCTCPDFEYREVEFCKHIIATKMWIATRHIQNKPKPQVFSEDSIQCDKCGSIRVMKYGYSANKQVYKCKDCQHKFRNSPLKKVKFSPELITLSLDLYFSGLSLRKISRNINDHFDINLNYSTIYTWIQKYIPLISNYVNSLKPKLGETWQADELFVKLRGGEPIKAGTEIGFLWNIMDRESRFLIASKLTDHRDVNACVEAFNEAIHNGNGKLPQKVHTDSYRAYREGVKVLGNAEHIANCGIAKLPHSSNNRAERLNGTLRERTKVQRGWKTKNTLIAEGQRIHYNFVKPHEALKGNTPSEKVGIGVGKGNKWKMLIQKANSDTNLPQ